MKPYYRIPWTLLAVTAAPLLWFAPILRMIESRVIGDGGDNYQFLGFQFLAQRLLAAGDFPFGWTDYWRYPVGIHFQTATDSTLLTIFGLLLYPIVGDPVGVYNLTIVGLLMLNAVLAYWAFRTWFDRAPAAVGALIYGLSFYSLAKVGGHVNLLSTAGFPLLAAGMWRLHRSNGAWRDWAFLTFACVYLAFASIQYPVIVVGIAPILMVIAWWCVPVDVRGLLRTIGRSWPRAVASVAAMGAAFSLFHGRKLVDLVTGVLILPGTELADVSAVNWFIPNAYVPTLAATLPNGTPSWIESAVFLSLSALIEVDRRRSDLGC